MEITHHNKIDTSIYLETSNYKPDNQFSRPGIYDRIQKEALGKLRALCNLPVRRG